MSGGHWDYSGFNIQDALQRMANDEDVKTRWPKIAEIFKGLSDIIYHAEHEMDWDLCGDSHIPDDMEFDHKIVGLTLTSVMKACPDEWFSKGKWATIQAFQERSGCEDIILKEV